MPIQASRGISWKQIEGKTFVQYADVEQASKLGTTLLVALGAKSHPASRTSSELLNRKHRAFTLLSRAYDEGRRALSYLRWHEDDVELIAPSLYRKARRRVKEVEEAEEVEVEDGGEEVEQADEEEAEVVGAVDEAAVGDGATAAE